MKRLRITFLSGDVHCAAVGVLKTLPQQTGGKGGGVIDVSPSIDYRYMLNIITSAIVNTPFVASTLMITFTRLICATFRSPPVAVIGMVCTLANKTHKTLHHVNTDEIMVDIILVHFIVATYHSFLSCRSLHMTLTAQRATGTRLSWGGETGVRFGGTRTRGTWCLIFGWRKGRVWVRVLGTSVLNGSDGTSMSLQVSSSSSSSAVGGRIMML